VAHFILIHGASHGGWCWEKVVPLLKAQGHSVAAPDLPGGGEDRTRLSDIDLPLYVKRVVQAIDAAPSKAVLVGHSMGGVSITEAGEARPDKIGCLVYLTAMMPLDGQYAREISARAPGSLLSRSIEMANDGISYAYKKSNVAALFYNDCTPEDLFNATRRLKAMPRNVTMTPVRTTPQRFGRLKRVYIECTLDQAIPLDLQRYMEKALPPDRTITMQTGHSPFLSAPDELAGHFEDIAKWVAL
jgi:pimeloyl-ACP methyl ester carboxylesterase